MSDSIRWDVAGIGNAIVDVLTQAGDDLLERFDLAKGTMTLVDEERAEAIYAALGPAVECSGGSAANTVAGIAALGRRAAYIGKVRDDQLGTVFTHDIRAAGVHFVTPPATAGPTTARCLVLVTPDAQRTMATYLGASVGFGPDDVDPAVIRASRVTYLEGYLFDRPEAKRAFERAASIAHAAGRRVALSLSDPFCVERHRDDFRELVDGHVDILFANEAEITSLYQVASFDDAVEAVRGRAEIAALTRSEKGSVVVADGAVHWEPAAPVGRVVDTTGAGDLYAAGFLSGWTRGEPLPRCARRAALAASEIISHFGARPEVDLSDWVETRLARD